MRKILLLVLLVGGSRLGWAQQTAQYTQYIFNGLGINPAYAGSKGVVNISGLYRTQWTGLEGAPTTQTLSIDGAVAKQRVGLGLQVVNDQIGAQGQKSVYSNVAFRVKLSETSRIALGMAAGATQYYTDGTKLHYNDQNIDPTVPTTKESATMPDVKAGLFFHSERFYVGLSAANIVRFKSKFITTPARHYYFTMGYIFPVGEWFKFKPSILVKQDFKSPVNFDLNAFMLIGDRIWLGGSYRTGTRYFTDSPQDQELQVANAWALASEIYLTEKIKIGYAHDFTLTSLRDYVSHEVSLGFYLYKKAESRTLTIRYF